MKCPILLIAGALCVMTDYSAALAQIACTDRQTMLESMAGKYQEAPAAGGLTTNGILLQLLISRRNDDQPETWTIVIIRPDGMSCVVAAGEDWTPVEWQAPAAPGMEN